MFQWLKEVFAENAKKLLGGGLAAAALALVTVTWLAFESNVKAFIIKTTVDNLSKEDGELSVALKTALAKLRQSDVGALTVGNFLLSTASRSFTLYFYFPDGYKGKIFYTLKGEVIPNKRYVVLAPPNSKPIPLKLNEDSIILEKYFQPASGQAELLKDIFEGSSSSQKFQSSLRAVTFQLEGSDLNPVVAVADKNKLSLAGSRQLQPVEIEVSYAVVISPTIQLSQ
jgi:hypothetical protein